MPDTRIKICGVTSPGDARLCDSFGTDYIGLIFAKSPRKISLSTALKIRAAVPRAELVGVFADTPVGDVVDICRSGAIDMLQLHGSESPGYCETLSSYLSLPIIKAFCLDRLSGTNKINDYSRTSYFLFDLDKNGRGGPRNCESLNGKLEKLWTEAAKTQQRGFRIFLGGSLNARNVKEAMRRVNPYCVDVSSGVEKSPGIKDASALALFFREVRQ